MCGKNTDLMCVIIFLFLIRPLVTPGIDTINEGVQKVFGTLVFVVRHVVYFDTSHISTPFPVTSAFETVMDFPV